jgi:regulation of enolase protein 1 (concanavalin A-like superfamily)
LTFLVNFTIKAQNSDNLVINSIYKPFFWEYKPESFTIKKDTLVIVAGDKTNLFRAPNEKYNVTNAPQLLFAPDDDFVLIASIEHPFLAKFDAGGIILKTTV